MKKLLTLIVLFFALGGKGQTQADTSMFHIGDLVTREYSIRSGFDTSLTFMGTGEIIFMPDTMGVIVMLVKMVRMDADIIRDLQNKLPRDLFHQTLFIKPKFNHQ